MHFLSYRGPGAAGGLSSALSASWTGPARADRGWWYFMDNTLRFSPGPQAPSLVACVDEAIVEGHYRFCNEFLWPLMHELTEFCSFNADDFASYKALQQTVAENVKKKSDPLFVQDYHFALLPSFIPNNTSIFWHIPWPKHVDAVWQPLIKDISVRMLNCDKIGFHTQEYARNFLNGLDPAVRGFAKSKLVVAPIGVNPQAWHRRAADLATSLPEEIAELETPYILSVDRADYAKGIVERLHAIDLFFDRHPEQRGRITFVQLCAPSRTGLSAYNSYWHKCRSLEESINTRWQKDQWRPIVWIERGFAPDKLAKIYAKADGMLITSLKDGLNLTAKEYVACQLRNPGVLMLSHNAGAWTELGEFALELDPGAPSTIVSAIGRAISMPYEERSSRIRNMKRIIAGNPLSRWTGQFVDEPVIAAPDVIELFTKMKGRTS